MAEKVATVTVDVPIYAKVNDQEIPLGTVSMDIPITISA